MKKALGMVVALAAALLGLGAVAPQAGASSYSLYNQVFTVNAGGQQRSIVVDIQGVYNSYTFNTEFSCTATSPGAIVASISCGQNGVNNGVPGANLGSTTTAFGFSAFRTSSICFRTEFIYPGTSDRGIVGPICTAPVSLAPLSP